MMNYKQLLQYQLWQADCMYILTVEAQGAIFHVGHSTEAGAN